MFEQNQAKQIELLSVFEELPSLYQDLIRVLSLFFAPLPLNALQKELTELGIERQGKRWTQQSLSDALHLLKQRTLIHEHHDGFSLSPLLQEVVAQETFQSGHYDLWLRQTPRTHFLHKANTRRIAKTAEDIGRDFRISLYTHRWDRVLFLAELLHERHQHPHPLFALIKRVFVPTWFTQFPPTTLTRIFAYLLEHCFHTLSSHQHYSQLLELYCANIEDCPDELYSLLAQQSLWEGSPHDALALLENNMSPSALSIKAAAHLLLYQLPKSREHFDMVYNERLPKRLFNKNFVACCHATLSLLLTDLPFEGEEALSLSHSYYEKALEIFAFLHQYTTSNTAPLILSEDLDELVPYARFLLALAYTITEEPYPRSWTKQLEDDLTAAKEHGYFWLADEIAALLKRQFPHNTYYTQLDTERRSSCVPLAKEWTPKQAWEFALEALSNISPTHNTPGNRQEEKTKRLVWLFELEKSILPRPIYQKRKKDGTWSKGRVIGLDRLYRFIDEFDYLDPKDHVVCQYIQPTALRQNEVVIMYKGVYSHSNGPLELDAEALFELVDHPHLCLQQGKERIPVQLREVPPALYIKTQREESVNVQLRPFPNKEEIALTHADAHTLHLTKFQEAHFQIAEIVGKHGLTIPTWGQERLFDMLHQLAPLLPIHSEVTGDIAQAQQVQADPHLHVYLRPKESGLQVALWVRPFGNIGATYPPGEGSPQLLFHTEGQTFQTHRDFDTERQSKEALLQACPTLLSYEEELGQWYIQLPLDALHVLAELRAVQHLYTIKWPQGKSFEVIGEKDWSDLHLHIDERDGWFALSGSIELDEGYIIQLTHLLKLMENTSGSFVELDNGRFIALTAQLREKLRMLRGLPHREEEESALFPKVAGLTLDQLLQESTLTASAKWRAYTQKSRHIEQRTHPVPEDFQATLRPYQESGFQWLMRMGQWELGACLADDMGLGKTVQSLAMISTYASKGPSIVVAPTSVLFNWQQEISRFTPSLQGHILHHFSDRAENIAALGRGDVLLCSYALLHIERPSLQEIEWSCVVLDEAQAIKNPQSKRARAAAALKGQHKVAMTGTPIENNLDELWSLFHFLNPGLLGTQRHFKEHFSKRIEQYDDTLTRQSLRRLLKPFILRRRKEDVLDDLPEKTEINELIEQSKEEAHIYEALRRRAQERISNNDSPTAQRRFLILSELTKLRQASCHPKLVLPESKVESSKLQRFTELATELREGGHKALVFSQFVKHLKILQETLDRLGYSYVYLDGSTPQTQRQTCIERFQSGEVDFFLISLRAGGVGLNLTQANYVIHMDPWWNPAVESQASDRAHRIGQTQPVTIIRLITKDSVEEKILALHQQKRALADALLEGSEQAGTLSIEQLMELFEESFAETKITEVDTP